MLCFPIHNLDAKIRKKINDELFALFLVFLHINMYDDIINSTLSSLVAGGVILYPTDTVWGIGCDASNHVAVEKIYRLKHRDHTKSMLLLVADSFATGIEIIDNLLHCSSRPTTVILPISIMRTACYNIADNLPASDNTIGVRIPKHSFCQALLSRLKQPLVSTSANFSGQPTPANFDEIDPRLASAVDFCVPNLPQLTNGSSLPSRILKATPFGQITVIRD